MWLLRNDPLTQGPRLFARNCASCHRYDGHNGLGAPVTDPQSAPDLKGFATLFDAAAARGLLIALYYGLPNLSTFSQITPTS